MENSKKGAFASVAITNNGGYQQDGLTKLEYFAGLAMQGMLANPQFIERDPETIAEDSFCYAKALLEEFEIN